MEARERRVYIAMYDRDKNEQYGMFIEGNLAMRKLCTALNFGVHEGGIDINKLYGKLMSHESPVRFSCATDMEDSTKAGWIEGWDAPITDVVIYPDKIGLTYSNPGIDDIMESDRVAVITMENGGKSVMMSLLDMNQKLLAEQSFKNWYGFIPLRTYENMEV